MTSRHAVVEAVCDALTDAATEACKEYETTSSELASAALTFAQRVMSGVLALDQEHAAANRKILRNGVYTLLLHLGDDA